LNLGYLRFCRSSRLGQKLEEVFEGKDADEEMKKIVEFY